MGGAGGAPQLPSGGGFPGGAPFNPNQFKK
jgi:hypothetical protein